MTSMTQTPDQSIRLLSVCETAQGGVGAYQNILQSLTKVGFEIHVVAPRQHAAIFETGLHVSTFENPRRSLLTPWRLIQGFRTARRKFQPDICFFHSTFSLAALAWARLTSRSGALVYCAHGWAARNYETNSLKARVVRLIEGTLCGLADAVVNVSQAEKELAHAHGYRGKHIVIDNAVPSAAVDAKEDLFADAPDQTNFLFVGRFDRQKGVDLLLPAFEAARKLRPDLTLHIVGSAVREAAAISRLPEGVKLTGWVPADRIDNWYRSADALIVSSRWEGLPLVIPEAYRNGTPVLCSNASGMNKLVIDDETGCSFDLTVLDMTNAMVRYTKSDLRAMRPAAKQRYLDYYQVARLRDEMSAVLRRLV